MEKRDKTLRTFGFVVLSLALSCLVVSFSYSFAEDMIENGFIDLFCGFVFLSMALVFYILGAKSFKFYVVALSMTITYFVAMNIYYSLCYFYRIPYLFDGMASDFTIIASVLIICLLPYAKSNSGKPKKQKESKIIDDVDYSVKSNDDCYAELKTIKSLYDEGIFNEEEYKARKEIILKKIQ